MTLMEDVVALQARVNTAQKERNRAEGTRDAALAAADRARADLEHDFGVRTAAEAKTLLDQLTTELAHLADQVSTALDEIGL